MSSSHRADLERALDSLTAASDSGKTSQFGKLGRLLSLFSKGKVAANVTHPEALTGEAVELFNLASALREESEQPPTNEFVAALGDRISRQAPFLLPQGELSKTPVSVSVGKLGFLARFGSNRASVAAVLVFVIALSTLSLRSIPGEGLYGVKRTSESARLAMVWGISEAEYLVKLADRRLGEVDALLESEGIAAGLLDSKPVAYRPASPGELAFALDLNRMQPMLVAQEQNNVSPRIVKLISETLEDARESLEAAAKVLIVSNGNSQALKRLSEVAHRGETTIATVSANLPEATESIPLEITRIAMSVVAEQADQARQELDHPVATIRPCATPTPAPTATPEPTPSASPEASEEDSQPGTTDEEATPEPTPSATPKPTPCATPIPTTAPDPTAAPAEAQTAEPTETPVQPTPQPTQRPANTPRSTPNE